VSLFPLDLGRYKDWTIQQLYYLLFPYIKEDFMGRLDCQAVHTEGNMLAGETPVTHIISGGSDSLLASKEAEYSAAAEAGVVTLTTAQTTGEFTGTAT
jgi:hypothetical protein